MFWIGLVVGWFTAAPLVILALALARAAANADRHFRDTWEARTK